MSLNLKCNEKRILLRRISLEAKSAGGIILGDITSREDDGAAYAVVEASHEDNIFKVGEVVSYNPRLPIKFNWRGHYYELMRENDVYFSVPEDEMKTLNIKEFSESEGKEEVYNNPGNFQQSATQKALSSATKDNPNAFFLNGK